MSNKRNSRRRGQRVRAEVSRKPIRTTKAAGALVAAQPSERTRKELLRYRTKPTKRERQDREKRLRGRWLGKPRKVRKPRRVYGKTYWNHSLDM